MTDITNTNVRVGPGVYLALKHMSDKTGISIGGWANFLIAGFLVTKSGTGLTKGLPAEIQTALASDLLSVFGDLLKMIGLEAIKDTSIADLYQRLLNPEKNPLVS